MTFPKPRSRRSLAPSLRPAGLPAQLLGALGLLLSLGLTGCGAWVRTHDLRPPLSPLLDSPRPQSLAPPIGGQRDARLHSAAPARTAHAAQGSRWAPQPVAPSRVAPAAPSREASQSAQPSPSAHRHIPLNDPQWRAKLTQRLETLQGLRQLEGQPVQDLSLLRAAFSPLRGALANAQNASDIRRLSVPSRRTPVEGDLLWFEEGEGVPTVCVVHSQLKNQVIQAACALRGAIRWVHVDPQNPTTRRDPRGIRNSFLRVRTPQDAPGLAYLSGALLREVRTPLH